MANITDAEKVAKIDRLISTFEQERMRYERQWYVNIAFYENNHFVFYNKATRTVDRVQQSPGSILRCIPKARRQIEAINNMILASEIRWMVIPDGKDPNDVTGAQRVNQYLQEKWQEWNIRNNLDELVLNALVMNVSYLVAGFDENTDDIFVDVKDAFDVYHPAMISNLEDSPVVIVTYKKNKLDIEANGKYKNKDKVIYDAKTAQSAFKEARLSDKFGGGSTTPIDPETQTTILKKAYYKIKDPNGDTKIKCITTAGGQKLLEEMYKSSQYPVVMYKPLPGVAYQPAWIEKYISMNKSLDVFVSQIENFTNLMVRGRWMKRKGNNISRMTNQDGEFIEYDSEPPTVAEIPALPSFLFSHTQNLEKWMEEQGVSTVALGKVPSGVRAYKALESLKQSDYANMRIPVANLQDTLQKLTEKILDLAANYYLLPKTIYRSENEQSDSFQVIGERGAGLDINQEPMSGETPPTVIKKSYRVKTVVDSGLSYTEEGKRDTLRELYQAGVIDKRTLMEGFKFSNVADIMERVQAETGVSMTETPDFQILPDDMKKIILQYLSEPAVAATNPLAQKEISENQRKPAQKSMQK